MRCCYGVAPPFDVTMIWDAIISPNAHGLQGTHNNDLLSVQRQVTSFGASGWPHHVTTHYSYDNSSFHTTQVLAWFYGNCDVLANKICAAFLIWPIFFSVTSSAMYSGKSQIYDNMTNMVMLGFLTWQGCFHWVIKDRLALCDCPGHHFGASCLNTVIQVAISIAVKYW